MTQFTSQYEQEADDNWKDAVLDKLTDIRNILSFIRHPDPAQTFAAKAASDMWTNGYVRASVRHVLEYVNGHLKECADGKMDAAAVIHSTLLLVDELLKRSERINR